MTARTAARGPAACGTVRARLAYPSTRPVSGTQIPHASMSGSASAITSCG
ncbi:MULTISPECIES: hypothetical protein [unclassified Streptomyces]|nr:hypothetical protein [Streptomyces sp. TSRI0281]